MEEQGSRAQIESQPSLNIATPDLLGCCIQAHRMQCINPDMARFPGRTRYIEENPDYYEPFAWRILHHDDKNYWLYFPTRDVDDLWLALVETIDRPVPFEISVSYRISQKAYDLARFRVLTRLIYPFYCSYPFFLDDAIDQYLRNNGVELLNTETVVYDDEGFNILEMTELIAMLRFLEKYEIPLQEGSSFLKIIIGDDYIEFEEVELTMAQYQRRLVEAIFKEIENPSDEMRIHYEEVGIVLASRMVPFQSPN
jgi:hypothetical protein